ncbi:MAG: Crp/Fnr family transcriptional regulator [Pseudomonadota bacterium]
MAVPSPASIRTCTIVSLEAGTQIFQAADPCTQFFYLLEGQVRVDLVAESGKTVMLYRFGEGETCVLTTACLFSGDAYGAEAIVEQDVRAHVVPLATFEDLLNTSADFRALVFNTFGHRLSDMMAKVEEVAFVSLGARLSKRLLELAGDGPVVQQTHEQLALDLGSAREVVSRKLSQWERDGLIVRARGIITLVKKAQLCELARRRD